MRMFDLQSDKELEQNRKDFLKFMGTLVIDARLPDKNRSAYRIHATLVDRIEDEQRKRRNALLEG